MTSTPCYTQKLKIENSNSVLYALFYDDGGQGKEGQVMTLKGYKSIKYKQKAVLYK
jgi:hypothetical protein